MVIRLKEPYWFIIRENIKLTKEYGHSLSKLIKTWLFTQIRFYRELHFKRCRLTVKSHFWGMNGYCLRCGVSKVDFNRIRHEIRTRYNK